MLYDEDTNLLVTNTTRKYVPLGETLSPEALGLIPSVYAGYDINYEITWSRGTSSAVSINSITGEVKALTLGEATISLIASFEGNEITSEQSYKLIVIPLASDTYFIKNLYSNWLIDAVNATPSSAAEVYQREYLGGVSQKWEVTHLGNSTYSIKTKTSDSVDYYLSASGGPTDSNAAIVLTSNSLSSSMRWTIEQTDTGNIRIKPQAWNSTTTDYVLGSYAGLLSSEDGTLVPCVYYDDTDYQDEWIFSKVAYECVNYYDSSFPSNLVSSVPSAVNYVDKVYEKQFGINFSCSGSIIYDSDALADQCSTGIHSSCTAGTCGSDCAATHHKNTERISNQLLARRNRQNQISVLWTNRDSNTYCYMINGLHETLGAMAQVWYERPVVHIMSLVSESNTTAEYQACMLLLLAHETAHTLGFWPEAYNNALHDAEDNWYCVMEAYESDCDELLDFYDKLTKGLANAFCSSCAATLKNTIASEGVS